MIQRFPYKKHLNLEWHEAAIGYLLFFKNLKQKYDNNIYFLVSESGISLKANNPEVLKNAEQEVNKFYNTSKIQMLDLSYSSGFYQKILEDIKSYTTKLKDNKDCPYINLVYSEKIRQSCMSLKGFKYTYPYEMWEEEERNNKGFSYLIVRPDYRWKQVENAVYNMVNKREAQIVKPIAQPKIWFIELPFQKFIWIYLKKEFKQYKDMIEIKDSKNETTICIGVNNQLPILNELEKQIESLNYQIMESPPSNLKELFEGAPFVVLSPLQLERIMENLYHEFGISNQLRRIKHLNNNSCLIVGPVEIELWMAKKQEFFNREPCPQLTKLQASQIKLIQRLNGKNEVIEYQDCRYFAKRYQKPLKSNTLNQLRINCPALPRFFYYYQKQNSFYLMRHYYYKLFQPHYAASTPSQKLEWLQSLGQIIIQLHRNNVAIGSHFRDCIYMEGESLVVDCKQKGQMAKDNEQYKKMLREALEDYEVVDHTEQLIISGIEEHLEKESGISKVVESLQNFRWLFL